MNINREAFLQKYRDRILRFSVLCREENLIPFADFKVIELSAAIKKLKHHPDSFVHKILKNAFKYVFECFRSCFPNDDLIRRILGISLICPAVDENTAVDENGI